MPNNNNNNNNPMSNGMSTSLAGIAYGLASTGMNQYLTDKNRESDFENYKEAQQMNFQMAQNMQQSAPMSTKYGMAAAGLNPQQMNTSSSPAPVNSAPLASTSTAPVNLAQDNNLMADAKLKNAEAEKVELQNDQTKGENESSLANYVKQMDMLANAYEKRGWTQQAEAIRDDLQTIADKRKEGTLVWNVGHLKGALNAFAGAEQTQQRLSNMLEQFLSTEKNYIMLNNGSAKDFAEMPKLQKDLLVENIAVQIAEHAYLMSGVDLNSEQMTTLNKQREKIDSEIATMVQQRQLTKAQAEQIKNADWKSLFRNGEWMQGFIALGDDYTKELLHSVSSILGAVTFAKGAKKVVKKLDDAVTKYSNGVPSDEQ